MSGPPPSLVRRASTAGAGMIAFLAMLLFGLAGTLAWWQAWLFLATYAGWTAGVTVWLWKTNRALLERRMRGGPLAEKQPAQKRIMALASAGFVGLLAVPALDRRFGWSDAPAWLALAGQALFSLGWIAVVRVFRENAFAASTVETMPGQTTISTGPYALVRHPMYAGGLVLLLGVPLSLGSWWGTLPLVAIVPALVWRLLDEERLLARDLAGYGAYQRTVRYRLIPGVW